MRDKILLHLFLDHLHKNGALRLPPEDLMASVDIVTERFVIAENGGPGYEEIQATKTALELLEKNA